MFKLRVFLLVLCMAGLFLALLATASPQKLTREHPADVSGQMRGQNAVSLAPSGTVAGVLQELLPAASGVSEECEGATDRSIGYSSLFWLVDRLDGTKEFVKRTNEFTVNVALMKDRLSVLGIVHAPALNLTYRGGQELGAWRQTRGEPPTPISTRKVDSSEFVIVASKDHVGLWVSAMLSRLSHREIRSMGSSLKFCLVAEGKADIYCETCRRWSGIQLQPSASLKRQVEAFTHSTASRCLTQTLSEKPANHNSRGYFVRLRIARLRFVSVSAKIY